ncbi:MAG: fibronectin type III domain-containing protein, partial [Clostridia bacterium]|nr:fibronectin type III domain-containing protein [Clostridia bacterium]
YESKKSEVFSVSTKPAKVKTLKATAGPNEVSLKWSKVKNASYYKVYLYDSGKKKYVEKKKLTGTSYTLSSLGYAKKHKVRVRAFIKSDAGTVSSALTTVSFRTLPKDIANVKLSSATTTSQTLKWSKSTGATDYYVYRYNSSTDSYKRIATTSETSITVKNLKKGTKYSYKIRPVVIENGKTVLSGNATKAYRFSTK